MKQVSIIGLGLIGASMGLALKRVSRPPRVLGYDIDYDAAQRSLKMKAVDKVERYLPDAVKDSDMVVLATPIGAFTELLKTLAPMLSPGTLVTDTGSTKRQVVRWAQEILPETVAFVGGHPMTGKLTGGTDDPDGAIYAGATYCMTPGPSTPPWAVEKATEFVKSIGAQPFYVDPAEHDGLVAGISHLPYLLSAALMGSLAKQTGWKEMSGLAAGGFEVSTRLAAQDPKLFSGILSSNADNVVRQLDMLMRELGVLRGHLAANDEGLAKQMEEAHRFRTEWEEERRRAEVDR